ncbi:MAG: KEOPS complex kinase/ATPase Bud32 [Candidatus Woesearchaeota archaeon]
MKVISRGAEAIIYENNNRILKSRPEKNYRIKEIDSKLRKYRTRREARILEKLEKLNFPSPRLIKVDEERAEIAMEKIKGKKLRDVLKKQNFVAYCRKIGELIASLHENNIVHNDLTTSNFIVSENNELFLIDFGLSFVSLKVEDKAVDLHLLKQALESKHYDIFEDAFRTILEEYSKKYKEADDVVKRLKKVESRGRYKNK